MTADTARPLRIAIGGVHIECSTFSSHRSTLADFRLRRDAELLQQYDFVVGPSPISGVEWIPLLDARALPGGSVTPETYEVIRTELLDRIGASGDLDGLLLDLHGAMAVVGRTDIEAALMADVRDLVGPDLLVAAPMDLHGNVSGQLARSVDILTAHRMAPHEDEWITRRRAAQILVQCLRADVRPLRAWVQIPVLLPGEKTSTRVEPAASLYGRLPGYAERPGVLDAALWVGYAWADEQRCRAAVVITGTDGAELTGIAEELAGEYFRVRNDFDFVGPVGTFAECIDEALDCDARPYLISDTGDNPTAGGSGDSTYATTCLLADHRFAADGSTAIAASIFDPAAIASLAGHRIGDHVQVAAGAWLDDRPAPPLMLSGLLRARIVDDIGGTVVDVIVGGVHVLITQRRKPYHRMADLHALGLDPAAVDVVVIKIGYLEPDLHAAAAGWRMALTPGGVDQRVEQLGYDRLVRPIAPLDTMPTADLTVTLFDRRDESTAVRGPGPAAP